MPSHTCLNPLPQHYFLLLPSAVALPSPACLPTFCTRPQATGKFYILSLLFTPTVSSIAFSTFIGNISDHFSRLTSRILPLQWPSLCLYPPTPNYVCVSLLSALSWHNILSVSWHSVGANYIYWNEHLSQVLFLSVSYMCVEVFDLTHSYWAPTVIAMVEDTAVIEWFLCNMLHLCQTTVLLFSLKASNGHWAQEI